MRVIDSIVAFLGEHKPVIVQRVIGGLIVVVLVGAVTAAYRKYQHNIEVNKFLGSADSLIRMERYDDVPQSADHLSEDIRNDNRVQLAIKKAQVFKAALGREVFANSDNSELQKLRADAEQFESTEHSAESASLLGVIYSLLDRPEKAIDLFRTATKRDGRYANTYNYWGYALMEWRLSEPPDSWAIASEKKFRKALEINPRYEWPLINLGDLSLERVDEPSNKDYETANNYFEQAEALASHNPNATMDSAVSLAALGKSCQAGDKARATEYFGRASAKFKKANQEFGLDSAILHLDWGQLFDVTDDGAQALTHYDTALQLQPKFTEARISRAALLEKLKRFQAARDEYERCGEETEHVADLLGARAKDTLDPSAATRLKALEGELREKKAELNERAMAIGHGRH